MTSARTMDGGVLHFPGSMITDSVNVIEPPPAASLPGMAAVIRDDELLLFVKRLVSGARKRRFSDRWRHVNRSRLELARLCIERALAEQFG